MITLLCTLAGHVAMAAVRQSPYVCPDGLREALEAFVASARPTLRSLMGVWFLEFETGAEIEAFLREHLLPIPEVAAWNEPKSGRGGDFVFVTRNGGPSPDDDIIDLDALVENIARTVHAEELAEFEWHARYEREHGPPPGEG